MSKAHGDYEGLTRGQMRDISRSVKTKRQLAIHYGVREATILAVRKHFRTAAVRNRRAALGWAA